MLETRFWLFQCSKNPRCNASETENAIVHGNEDRSRSRSPRSRSGPATNDDSTIGTGLTGMGIVNDGIDETKGRKLFINC